MYSVYLCGKQIHELLHEKFVIAVVETEVPAQLIHILLTFPAQYMFGNYN